MAQTDMKDLQEKLQNHPIEQQFKFLHDQWGDQLVLASSLGLEDQVLTHAFIQAVPEARIFMLDTGRLHPETYDTMAKTSQAYHFHYEAYYPDQAALEAMVREKGINLFYESIENRKQCCGARKVEPLRRALSTADAWVTGLRRSQSVTRTDLQLVDWDTTHDMIKINLLAHWTEAEIWAYIKQHKVPYNPLHDQGFPSIGCAPCTRAIKEGEDIRAGRWWWESPEHKECGLHVVDGKLVPEHKKNNHKKGRDQ